jgi:hypothetical protein
LRDIITAQVARLVRLDQDTLEVVVRPEAGTHLHLHVAQRDGFVEVRARLESGFTTRDGLASQWGQLQELLASQGIRLAPLSETGGNAAAPHASTPHAAASPEGDAAPHERNRSHGRGPQGSFEPHEETSPARGDDAPRSRVGAKRREPVPAVAGRGWEALA